MTKLPAQKFFAYSRGEHITYEWQPPEVPDVAAPEHLADIYQHFRDWIVERHGPDAPEVKRQLEIDDAGVRALLRIAFFASLRTDEAIIDPALTPETGKLAFEPPETNPTLTEADLIRRFGTRHRSAYLLCKACPHTIVFVLSQDGGWRVFTSDDKSVRFTEHVSP